MCLCVCVLSTQLISDFLNSLLLSVYHKGKRKTSVMTKYQCVLVCFPYPCAALPRRHGSTELGLSPGHRCDTAKD